MTKTLDEAERSHRLDVDSYAGVWRFDPERSSVRFQVGFSCEGYDPPDGGGDIARRHQAIPPTRGVALGFGAVCCSSMGLACGSRRRRSTAPPPRRSPFRQPLLQLRSRYCRERELAAGPSCDQPDAQAKSRRGRLDTPQTRTLRCAFDRSPSPEERLRLRDLRRARCRFRHGRALRVCDHRRALA
jgi:hypothetical protein